MPDTARTRSPDLDPGAAGHCICGPVWRRSGCAELPSAILGLQATLYLDAGPAEVPPGWAEGALSPQSNLLPGRVLLMGGSFLSPVRLPGGTPGDGATVSSSCNDAVKHRGRLETRRAP